MLTINDLRDQFNLEGEIIVKSFDEMGEDEQTHFVGEADCLSAGNPLADKEIKFMYCGSENPKAITIEIVR
jgi:hypothetical protein